MASMAYEAQGEIDEQAARRARVANMARLLDTQFTLPVVGVRMGYDAIIGLIPGVGDAATGGLGVYLLYEAAKGGARKRALAKMALNLGIDTVVGAIPFVGDLFDIGFRSHAKNAKIALAEMDRRVAL